MKPSFASRLWVPILLALLASGCGYTLAGQGKNKLAPHLRTIAIPVFVNGSGEPEIHRDLTDAVRQAFISDGRLKIAPGAGADIVLKGNLNYYRLQAVAFSPTDVVSQYWVEVGLQVEAMDQVKKRVLLKQNFLTKWDYRITADVVDAERARQDALDQAYSDLANRLVSVLIEQF